LGLGSVATKTASDAAKTNAAMVNGATTIGHIATFSDVNGTIQDGGISSLTVINTFCNGRMTLTSGSPVTTANVTGATTIFFTPYNGNQISLFDGAATWNTLEFVETSIAVPGTTSTMYDLFAYNNSGTMALETATWTNDTTRATAIVLQNGVYVKNGATTRRYLGSFRTTTVNGQTEDSNAKRYVWNYYNRVARLMLVNETASTWTYSTATYRQANGNAANQLDYVLGVSEDFINATIVTNAINSTTTNRTVYGGIGVDSTTVNSATAFEQSTVNISFNTRIAAFYNAYSAIGRHILVWLEKGGGADTQTWAGTNGGLTASGISGSLFG